MSIHPNTDIDECGSVNGGCSQICINNIASYYCECEIGYTLNPDDHACDGMYNHTQ